MEEMKIELVKELENTKCKACGHLLEGDPALYPEFVNLEFSQRFNVIRRILKQLL